MLTASFPRRSAGTAKLPIALLLAVAAVGAVAVPGASADPMKLFATGETGGSSVVWEIDVDPFLPLSAVYSPVVVDPTYGLDGIAYVFYPGAKPFEVAVGAQVASFGTPIGGAITHYDPLAGTILPPFVSDTNLVTPSPGGPTAPSSLHTTETHIYYVENQFGFSTNPVSRILRVEIATGLVELVIDGADPVVLANLGVAIENFEGLEIVGGDLFFFAADPSVPPGTPLRALLSIPLDPSGLWDKAAPLPIAVLIPGLTAGPGGDGADELTFDPGVGPGGALFGTNIVTGEMIALDLASGLELPAPGVRFVSAAAVAASIGSLGILSREIDGIQPDLTGMLILAGRGGVLVAIDIAGVLGDGADDGDATVLADDPTVVFDDLAEPIPVTEFTGAPVVPRSGTGLVLRPARPNPFRDRTTVDYFLPAAGEARITVHDVAGRLVATVKSGAAPAGWSGVTWDGRDESGHTLAPGVYFLRIESSGEAGTGKFVKRE